MVQDNKVVGILTVPSNEANATAVYALVSRIYDQLENLKKPRRTKLSSKLPRRRVRYADTIDLNLIDE